MFVAVIAMRFRTAPGGGGPHVFFWLVNVSVPKRPPVSVPAPGWVSPAGGSPRPSPLDSASIWPCGSPLAPVWDGSRSLSPDTQYAWLPTRPSLAWLRAVSTTYVTWDGFLSTRADPRNAAAG